MDINKETGALVRQAIEKALDNYMQVSKTNLSYDITSVGVITAIKGIYHSLTIAGRPYTNILKIDTVPTLNVGDSVVVCLPKNVTNNMYIIGRLLSNITNIPTPTPSGGSSSTPNLINTRLNVAFLKGDDFRTSRIAILKYPLNDEIETSINNGTCILKLYKLKNRLSIKKVDIEPTPPEAEIKVLNKRIKRWGHALVSNNNTPVLGWGSGDFRDSLETKQITDTTKLVDNNPIQVEISITQNDIITVGGKRYIQITIDLDNIAIKMLYFTYQATASLKVFLPPTISYDITNGLTLIADTTGITNPSSYNGISRTIGSDNRKITRVHKYRYGLNIGDKEIALSDTISIIYTDITIRSDSTPITNIAVWVGYSLSNK